MDRVTHRMREEYWRSLIKQCNEECAQRNQSKMSWMEEHNVSDKSFYYWQKKLRDETAFEIVCRSSEASSLVQRQTVEFSSIEELSPKSVGSAHIHLGAATIELNDDISDNLLFRIMKAVSNV